MSATSPIKNHLWYFFNSNGFIIKKNEKEKREPTHMAMDGGGSYCVPPEALGDLYHAYGLDLVSGKTLFLIERNTPIFVLHFDIDFHSLVDEERTEEFLHVLCAAVNDYFTNIKKAIVCAILDKEGRRTGFGLHIIFPTAFVDTAMACAIWAGVVARCEEKLPWGMEAWGTTVDVAVLREKGSLRMVGSDKSKRCDQCSNDPHRKKCCAYCDGKGSIALGKIYWPWRMLPETDATREDLENMRLNRPHAARRCSIQSTRLKCSEDFQVPEGAPRPFEQSKRGFTRYDEGFKLPKKGNLTTLSITPEQLDALTQAIRSYDASFSQLVVKDTHRLPGRCWVRVRGFNDRFCLNKCGLHNSSQVYFELSERGFCQRCFSRKAEARAGGWKCCEFKGPMKLMPPVLVALLGAEEAPKPALNEEALARRPAAKRHKPNSSELVCYGGYHQITPDVYF
jgi:hypothetical protein